LCMKVRCLFFASSRDITKVSEKEYNLFLGTDTNQFLQIVREDFPGLQELLKSCLLALNLEYLEEKETKVLKDGDEIAVIPPLSGG